MKKLFTFILALAIGFGLKAQCPLTEAVDFTATDCHGTEVHLFDILDRGQAVLIDFFFTTCGPCQQATPKVVESYYAMGCNMHDVFYMEISPSDADAACQNWANTYGVEYPTIGTTGGGSTICNTYQISAYPTLILIMPNRQIVIQDLWPINNAQTVITALEGQGLQQHDCNAATYDPQVTVTIVDVTETTARVSFVPNEDCAAYYYNLLTEAEMQAWIDATGLEVAEILQNYGFESFESTTHLFDALDPNEVYYVWVVPADINGVLYEVQQVLVEYVPGPGDIMPDFTATDIDGNEIHLYDILDGGQTVLLNLFLRDANSEQIMPFVTESYQLFGCNQNDVFYIEICPQDEDEECRAWAEQFGVKYPTISRTGGGNDIAQSIPVAYYPTVIIVNPDHTYAYRDLYPIEGTFTIVNALEGLGCEQHECPIIEGLVLSTDTVYVYQGCLMDPGVFTITNMTAEDVQIIGYTSEEFGLECDSGYDGSDITGMIVAPSDSLTIRVWAYPYSMVHTGAMRLITSIGEYEVTIVYEDDWGMEETQSNNYSLFPNPANDFVTLNGENLGTVRVYNTLGQKVEEIEANASELRINTANYESGIYFVKTAETTLRFVVKH